MRTERPMLEVHKLKIDWAAQRYLFVESRHGEKFKAKLPCRELLIAFKTGGRRERNLAIVQSLVGSVH